jgi:hypothetical protein
MLMDGDGLEVRFGRRLGGGRLPRGSLHTAGAWVPGCLARIAKLRDVTGQSCRAQAQAVGRSLLPVTGQPLTRAHWLSVPRHRSEVDREATKARVFEMLFSAASPAPKGPYRFSPHSERKLGKLKRRTCQMRTSMSLGDLTFTPRPAPTNGQPQSRPEGIHSLSGIRCASRSGRPLTNYLAAPDLATESSLSGSTNTGRKQTRRIVSPRIQNFGFQHQGFNRHRAGCTMHLLGHISLRAD